MICLILIMTMIFVNGIESVEQKVKHSGTVLREEEMNAKTKAWLLMVESGKVDEEDLRRITPKSIFIAPLLTEREVKCKEGYRHDHLGRCVKVIKMDPKVQLELLLKRLSMLYSEKHEEEGLLEVSSGPLHFSLPIFGDNDDKANQTTIKTKAEIHSVSTNAPEVQNTAEFIPIPLPMVLINRTSVEHETDHSNNTKEIESSGMGILNNTEPYDILQLEGSGFASGDSIPEEKTTVSLFSDETDYFDVTETESTTEFQYSTDFPLTTEAPIEDINSTESYQGITNLPSVNDSVIDFLNDTAQKPLAVENNTNSGIIIFPSDYEVRSQANPPVDSSSIVRFPGDLSQRQQSPTHHSRQSLPNWNSPYQIHPSTIPHQQFWWLPENWKVDEHQQKSTLVKFWSRLPLIHDVSYSGEKSDGFKKVFPPKQPQSQVFNTFNRNQDFPVRFSQQSPSPAIGKPFRSNRFQEVATPRQTFRIKR